MLMNPLSAAVTAQINVNQTIFPEVGQTMPFLTFLILKEIQTQSTILYKMLHICPKSSWQKS